MKGTANELKRALTEGVPMAFAQGGFDFDLPSQYGSALPVAMGLEAVRAAMPQVIGWTGFDLDEVRSYLNAMIDDAEADENSHPRGAIIDRRHSQQFSAGFLGTGAGTVTVHEAMVRIAEDFEDWSDDIIVQRKAGDEVWYRVSAPVHYERI